jgi:alkaline phosphatase D
MKKQFIFLFLILVQTAIAQNKNTNQGSIVSGPMLGYAEHTETLVWVQTKCAKKVSIQYRLEGTDFAWNSLSKINEGKQICDPLISKFVITNLEMGSTYEYRILLDELVQKSAYPLTFKTKVLWEWRTSPPNFTFMLGSCLYINDSAYDRPGKPYGGSTEILKTMAKTPADFMLWLGDNVYTREADYSSNSGMAYRYLHTRKEPSLQELLAKRNNYAIWDDHDYGDNDANKSFELKQNSIQLFQSYWGNKTYGQNGEGIYSNFRFADAEFILLDDRWFRDESELDETKILKNQLGETQMIWLKDKLKHSRASFKFVVVGGQFLNEHTDKESFNLYKRERAEIIQFIIDQKISGVVFLSGDRHHTELLLDESKKDKLGYTLYDLTSSSITAGSSDVLKGSEAKNPQRVEGTLVVENNFCTIQISGSKRGERLLIITCYDSKGIVKWGKTIFEKDLKAIH